MMGAPEWTMIALAIITTLFTIIGFLLRKRNEDLSSSNKDLKELVDKLFDLHDTDVKELQDFKYFIAREYIPKPEIRDMLNELQKHIDQRFDQLMMSNKQSFDKG